jgi:HSP20 family protein
MADVKVQKGEQQQQRSQQGAMERRGGGGLARREEWGRDLFTMNPFAMMRRLSEEMDRAFGTSFGLTRGFPSLAGDFGRFSPPIEIRQEGNDLVVSADLPGINKDDVRVECTQDGLIIEGERKRESEETRAGVQRTERSYGSFSRLVPLPEDADTEHAKAQFKDGVLEVRVPVPESSRKAKEIPIST